MSHAPKYVPTESFQSPMQPIKAGKTGQPEVITAGGVISALAKVLFSTNFAAGDSITFGGVTVTAVAANPTYIQFVPGVSLSASLDALVIQFQNLSMPVAGTYSKTDAATSITFTPTGYGSTGIGGFSYAAPVQASAVKTSGGTNTVSQVASITKALFSTNFAAGDSVTFNGVTYTAVASAPGVGQFLPNASLALTLSDLQQKFSTGVSPLVGSFSVTDAGTSLTYTPVQVVSATAYTVSAVKTSGGTNTATQSTNLGVPLTFASLDTEHTQFSTAGAFDVYLNDGDESQRKTFAMFGAGTVNLKGANLPSTTVNYAFNGADALVLQFLGAKWRLILNDGAAAS